MSALRDAMSHAVLGWVKPELDETLRLARAEVEFFAEDTADTSRMHFCAGYLHQVQGTLRMVELYAPAMVAEELELLARALQESTTTDRDEACGTLMRGTVLLPDYLERLQNGHRDIPIVLLPLLNDIRAARGAPGLSESVLFAPDLEQPLPQALPLPEVLPWQARQARVGDALEQFDQALSAWPEESAPANAVVLAESTRQLLESVEHIATRRMLWVASSVADALRDGALPATPLLRQAYAGVSRAVRSSQQEGGVGATAPSQEPTRQLLYLVAQSATGHAALDELRTAFALDAELPSEAELDHARGSVSGRNRALLDTVGAAVKEELLRIKDALDLHLRTGAQVSELQTQVNELGNVADTLGMLGLGVARGVVVQQRDSLREMVGGQRPADEGALLDIAGALLYVDASLDDQVARLGESGVAVEEMASSESQRTVEALAQEAIHNFSAAREGFVAFIETNWNHAELAEVPRLLSEVAGALRMLELPQPADYLLGVRQYVAIELIGKRRVPGGQQLDTLADAMASLEYYLEALRERRPNRDEILDITRSSLESLRYWPLPTEEAVAPTAATFADVIPVEADIPAVALDDTSIDAAAESYAADFDHASVAAVALDDTDPGLVALDTDALEALEVQEAMQALEAEAASVSFAEEPLAEEPLVEVSLVEEPLVGIVAMAEVEVPAAVPVTVRTVAQGGFDLVGNDIDDDIREVFMEEFDEEIVNLGQLLPAWSAAPGNMERLRPIRRVFHTLKGSGRLVGAKLLGEFSWKIENMLNRVLDGSRPPSDAVIALLEQSTKVLPQLNAALHGQGQISADLEGLQELSDRVGAGEEVFYSAKPTAAVEVETQQDVETAKTEIFEPETEGTPASVDGVLREILETEIGTHLETVDQWLAQARAAACLADESLLRAFHTMNGAFAMADVPEITEVTGAAEQYVKRLWAAKEIPSVEGVVALSDSAQAVRRCVAALQAASPRIPVFAALSAQLTSLRDSLPEARPSAVIVDDSAQGTYTEAMPAIEPPVSPGNVELSVHDLSAYFGHEQPVVVATEAIDSPAEPVTERVEATAGTDQANDELVFDDREVALEIENAEVKHAEIKVVEAGDAKPELAVTFFDVALTYAAAAPAAPVAESVGASIDSDGLETSPVEELAGDAASNEATPTETVAADGQTVEEPTPEQPAAEEVAAEEVAVEGIATEGFAIEEQAIEEQVIEEPAIEEPILEETAAEALVVEDQAIEDPAVQDHAVEAALAEELVIEEPAVDEPEFAVPAEEVQADQAEALEADALASASANIETVIDTVEPPSDVVPESPAMETGVEEPMDTVAAGSDGMVEAGD